MDRKGRQAITHYDLIFINDELLAGWLWLRSQGDFIARLKDGCPTECTARTLSLYIVGYVADALTLERAQLLFSFSLVLAKCCNHKSYLIESKDGVLKYHLVKVKVTYTIRIQVCNNSSYQINVVVKSHFFASKL